MKLILKKGEYKWSSDGVHVCDERGFAVVCEEDCEVEIPHPENFERASKVVAEDRKIRGVVPTFSIPAAPSPEPEAVPAEEPAPVTEAEAAPAQEPAPASEAEAAPAEPSSTESAPPAPEALPEQPAPEESAPAHAEPAPQEHGQESSVFPETPVAAEESAQDQPAP